MFKMSGILKEYTCSVLCMFWLSYPAPMLKRADCVQNRCLCCEYSRFSLICNVLFHFFANFLIDCLFPTLSAEIDFILNQIKKLLFCYCNKSLAFFSLMGKLFSSEINIILNSLLRHLNTPHISEHIKQIVRTNQCVLIQEEIK